MKVTMKVLGKATSPSLPIHCLQYSTLIQMLCVCLFHLYWYLCNTFLGTALLQSYAINSPSSDGVSLVFALSEGEALKQ